jgi:hypothetical protein
MLRKSFPCCTFLSLVISLAVSTDCQTAPAKVSAAEIVDRNVSGPGWPGSVAGGPDRVLEG